MASWIEALEAYSPRSEQEEADRALTLALARQDPEGILTRESLLAHITSSGLVLNPQGTKVLMAWHNIYRSWAWTGGHADGDGDLLAVALREAREETGVTEVAPLSPLPASVDILTVDGHVKRGRWVSSHLHLNVTYLLIAPEGQPLRPKEDENKEVAWLPADRLAEYCSEPEMLPVYEKLIARARGMLEDRHV